MAVKVRDIVEAVDGEQAQDASIQVLFFFNMFTMFTL